MHRAASKAAQEPSRARAGKRPAALLIRLVADFADRLGISRPDHVRLTSTATCLCGASAIARASGGVTPILYSGSSRSHVRGERHAQASR
jgi:hypothetical protein